MKKVLKLIGSVLLAIVLLLALVPFPQKIKDGGSVCWEPVIPAYSVTRWNGVGEAGGKSFHTGGSTVKLFGFTVHDSFERTWP